MAFAEVVFVVAASWVAYTYALYPLLMKLIPVRAKPHGDRGDLPRVSVILSAFNEESDIEARIENLLSQDYPSDKLKIYAGSDGSTDRTDEILKTYASHTQVHSFIFEENRGKASVLNDLVSASDGELLIFTDANTEFRPDNISRLVERFADSNIGGVCGELELYDPTQGRSDNQDSLYWRYERFLKRKASALGCLPGANGANYAIRRELYIPLSPQTIVDDLVVSCRVYLGGQRLVYEQGAIAREEQAPRVAAEFKRRVRIGSGNYQSLAWLGPVFAKAPWMFSFVFVSHKIMRWFVPHMMIIALVSSAWLAQSSALFFGLLALQVAVYVLCVLVYLTKQWTWPKSIQTVYFLVSMNVALGVGFLKYISQNAQPTWERTPR